MAPHMHECDVQAQTSTAATKASRPSSCGATDLGASDEPPRFMAPGRDRRLPGRERARFGTAAGRCDDPLLTRPSSCSEWRISVTLFAADVRQGDPLWMTPRTTLTAYGIMTVGRDDN